MRDALGLDPYANAAADRPMVLTPTGYVPIEANTGGDSNESVDDQGGNQTKNKGVQFAASSEQKVGALSALFGKYGYNPDEPRHRRQPVGAGGGRGA